MGNQLSRSLSTWWCYDNYNHVDFKIRKQVVTGANGKVKDDKQI